MNFIVVWGEIINLHTPESAVMHVHAMYYIHVIWRDVGRRERVRVVEGVRMVESRDDP